MIGEILSVSQYQHEIVQEESPNSKIEFRMLNTAKFGDFRTKGTHESKTLHSMIRNKRDAKISNQKSPIPKNGHEKDLLRISKFTQVEPLKIRGYGKPGTIYPKQSLNDAVNNRSEDSLDHQRLGQYQKKHLDNNSQIFEQAQSQQVNHKLQSSFQRNEIPQTAKMTSMSELGISAWGKQSNIKITQDGLFNDMLKTHYSEKN